MKKDCSCIWEDHWFCSLHGVFCCFCLDYEGLKKEKGLHHSDLIWWQTSFCPLISGNVQKFFSLAYFLYYIIHTYRLIYVHLFNCVVYVYFIIIIIYSFLVHLSIIFIFRLICWPVVVWLNIKSSKAKSKIMFYCSTVCLSHRPTATLWYRLVYNVL